MSLAKDAYKGQDEPSSNEEEAYVAFVEDNEEDPTLEVMHASPTIVVASP